MKTIVTVIMMTHNSDEYEGSSLRGRMNVRIAVLFHSYTFCNSDGTVRSGLYLTTVMPLEVFVY